LFIAAAAVVVVVAFVVVAFVLESKILTIPQQSN